MWDRNGGLGDTKACAKAQRWVRTGCFLYWGGGGVCAVSMWLRQLDSEARDQSPAA